MTDTYIIKIEPRKRPRAVPCSELTLGFIQETVNGYIEIVYLHDKINERFPALRMVVNENGKLYGLPFNGCALIIYDMRIDLILGTAILAIDAGEDLRPMTAQEAEEISEYFKQVWHITVEQEETEQ